MERSEVYRLRQWPQIPDRFRTARVLGACSRMTVGPVTARWFLSHTALDPAEASELVAALEAQGALERFDLGPCPQAQAAAAPAATSAVAKLRERLAHRLPWRQAALVAVVCLGISAALHGGTSDSLRLIALPALPAVSG